MEIGTLTCLNAYMNLNLSPARLAKLGQMAENHVVGAPCGIMDQIAITSGHRGRLTHILCRPGEIRGEIDIPPGTGFVGINSLVRHSVAGNPYADTRIGAFMGKRIVNDLRARTGRAQLDYLTELSVAEFESQFASKITARQEDIDRTITNVTELASKLNNASNRVDSILVKVDGFLGDADAPSLSAEARATLESFRKVANNLNAQIGPIAENLRRFSGSGLRDVEALVTDTRRTVQSLENTISTFDKNPQRLLFGGETVEQYDGRTRR